jgi:hypothetical protein
MEGAQLVFLVLALGLFALWLTIALVRRKPAAPPGTFAELRYGPFLRLFALTVALAIPALTIYIVWFLPWARLQQLLLAGVLFLSMSALGGLLLLETARVRLFLSAEGIVGYSPWRRRREIRWQDVRSVAYSSLNGWFIIVGADGRALRASRFLVGLPALLTALKKWVPAECSARIQRYLEKV